MAIKCCLVVWGEVNTQVCTITINVQKVREKFLLVFGYGHVLV
jgi:hypothetical protein